MDAASVAECGYRAMAAGRRVVVPGFVNQLFAGLVRVLKIKKARRAPKRTRAVARLRTGWPGLYRHVKGSNARATLKALRRAAPGVYRYVKRREGIT